METSDSAAFTDTDHLVLWGSCPLCHSICPALSISSFILLYITTDMTLFDTKQVLKMTHPFLRVDMKQNNTKSGETSTVS